MRPAVNNDENMILIDTYLRSILASPHALLDIYAHPEIEGRYIAVLFDGNFELHAECDIADLQGEED